MSVKFGIDRLLSEAGLRKVLSGQRIGMVGHPASVTSKLVHSLDALAAFEELNLSCAFGPQHGMRGDKQDNMIESDDYLDATLGIPIFSLYGASRRPTPEMMDHLDVVLFDLQDLGCRIYTYATTLLYVLEEAARHSKRVVILDRPNPIGRPLDGLSLRKGWESFVGAAEIPMRHGLTVGELANFYCDHFKLDVECSVIKMGGYRPDAHPDFGWPGAERAWVNPSPNAPNVNMARSYCGTVILEGTTLSEGRGTTRPLEMFGAPDISSADILREMQALAPHWLEGCKLRQVWFEPTFHKHSKKLCEGIQIHTDLPFYTHETFRPWCLMALFLKAVRRTNPDYPLWRDLSFDYEYTVGRLAIDTINGSDILRLWVDNPDAGPADLDQLLDTDLSQWKETAKKYHLY